MSADPDISIFTLKIGPTASSEKSVRIYQNTRRHSSEDRSLYSFYTRRCHETNSSLLFLALVCLCLAAYKICTLRASRSTH